MLFFAGKRENLPASIWFIVINRSDKGATKEDKSGVTEVMIILRLDRVMADRKMSLNELAEKVGIANVNLSKIKTGKISAIRFSTLDAICKALSCQPGDILEYRNDGQTFDPKRSRTGKKRAEKFLPSSDKKLRKTLANRLQFMRVCIIIVI